MFPELRRILADAFDLAAIGTEFVVEAYPVQVVTSWLGSRPAVAMRRYLMTTDAQFEAAVQRHDSSSAGDAEKAAQNPAQTTVRGDSQPVRPAHEKTPALQGFASRRET